MKYILYLGLVVLLLVPVQTTAQDPYAAVLTVTHPGVELRRSGTQNWLPLAAESVAPLGSGDMLRTDNTGRAMITFWDDAQTILLGNSTFQLDSLELGTGAAGELTAQLEGTAVHRLPDTAFSYHLDIGEAALTQAAGLFATWARPDGFYAVTVAEGNVELSAAGSAYNVSRNQGIYTGQEIFTFDPPWNVARMQGQIEGCPGIIDTTDDVMLRTRMGPGLGFTIIGGFDEQQPVQIMAINQSEGWYRIQYLNDFGWVQRLAVVTGCTDLPVLPDNTIELAPFVVNPLETELEMLQPFFGAPGENIWFYRWSQDDQ